MTHACLTDPSPVRQAEVLLEAWICGDTAGLEAAFDHIGHSRVRPIDRVENTRLELLKVVARGLKACPDRYAPRSISPILGLYLDLLIFLSNAAPARGKVTNSRSYNCTCRSNVDRVAIEMPTIDRMA